MSVDAGHELANALYIQIETFLVVNVKLCLLITMKWQWRGNVRLKSLTLLMGQHQGA